MPVIGRFNRAKTGGWDGKIRMLSAALSARFIPNDNRDTENSPNFRLVSATSELGAAWLRHSNANGQEYLSVQLDDPTFERPITAVLFYEEDGQHAQLVWTRDGRKPCATT